MAAARMIAIIGAAGGGSREMPLREGDHSMPKATIGPKPTAAEPRPNSKSAAVIELLRRPEGASLDDLTTATSWQPHTARAALTGLRKKGHEVAREKVDGVSRYRIAGADGR
jgi:hypothetical protein